MKSVLVCLTCFALLVLGAWMYLRTAAHGFSARSQPTRVEKLLAVAARDAAVPAAWKSRTNPVADSPAVEHEAMAHFADHCAVCHGNDGSGATTFGAGMYPKPPDMRLPATQGKTDGELFGLIENGVRMSGMPAFGGDGSADASWKLVRFLRHLPRLTDAEQAEMAHLNPKSPDEIEEEKQEADFLNGSDAPAAAPAHMHR